MNEAELVKVLAVDDKPANLLALEKILNSSEVEVVRASSGNEALEKLLEMEFACVLLDVQIPDIDGFELVKIIRGDSRTKHLPVIFVSGNSRSNSDILKGYELGAVDYLVKPIEPAIVRGKVKIFAELFCKELARKKAVEELRKAKDELEKRVLERTLQLSAQKEELARSNRDLAEFAFVSSHDLKEPLRTVSLYVQLLRRECELATDSKVSSYMEFIIEGTQRMQALIDDLLSYCRVNRQTETATDTDINRVVQSVLRDLGPAISESKAKVEVASLPQVPVREVQISRVFQNLIGNAIKFSGDGPPQVHVSAEELEDEYRFEVRDRGIGIDPRYHSKIFSIFQRLHTREQYAGNGIGLAVCMKTIELHGGKIWVESALGEGACFYFTLPKKSPQPEGWGATN